MEIGALIDDFLTDLFFFPVKDRVLRDPFVLNIDGDKIECFYRFEYSNKKTIIFFHGNGECARDYLGDYVNMVKDYAVNILIVEYRGYGNSTGNCNIENCLSDSLRIFDIMKIDPASTIVYGRSFGALPALHLAFYRQVGKLVLENGIYDVKNWIVRKLVDNGLHFLDVEAINKEVDYLLDNKYKMSNYNGETFILHCRYDTRISFEHAEMAYSDANPPKKLLPFTKGFHNMFFLPNKTEIKTFFDSILKK